MALKGYYECPKGEGCRREGPLVGYKGTYDVGGKQLQYVGDVYANCRVLEKNPRRDLAPLLDELAAKIAATCCGHQPPFTICAMPRGGTVIGGILADRTGWNFVEPEKRETVAATEISRAQTQLVFDKDSLARNEKIVILEDVFNNASTTADAIERAEERGAIVICIATLLNRSVKYDESFLYKGQNYPIVSLVEKPIPQYQQDAPEVSDDVKANNVVWKPKDEWGRLHLARYRADY